MNREEAIERFKGIKNSMSISLAQSKFYKSKAELNELCDMAISALQTEPNGYSRWLESIIVTDEPCWLCEDSIDDEWCHKNCGTKSSIQAECLRHFFKVLSADTEQTEPSEKQVTSKLKNPCDSLLTEESEDSKEQKSKLDHDREWIIGCIKHDGFIKTDRFDKANQIILEALEPTETSDLISRADAISIIGEYHADGYIDLVRGIEALPSVSAERVVRCKDCVHQTYCHQTVANTEVHADFKEYWSVGIEWCSRGKMK